MKGSILTLTSFNAQSICNKTPGVLEYLHDIDSDICFLSESWLKVNDKAKLAEIRDHGFNVISCPRRGRGGGVGFIYKNHIDLKRNNVPGFKSFEVVEGLLKGDGTTLRLCSIYRTGIKYKEFFDEFSSYLDLLLEKHGVPILCGDFNFHVEKDDDYYANRFLDLIKLKGFSQHVTSATHKAGGTLDLIITRDNITDFIHINNVETITHATDSDHHIVKFNTPFSLVTYKNKFKEIQWRDYKSIDIKQFKDDIRNSILCNPAMFLNIENAVDIYESTLTDILNRHAPIVVKKLRYNKNCWWNAKCTNARRTRRKAERKFRKFKNPQDKSDFKQASKNAAQVIKTTRNDFYKDKLKDCGNDAKKSYNIINNLLD